MDLVELAESIWIAVPISFAALMIAGLVFPTYWGYIFSFALSFITCDALSTILIHGDKGWVKIGSDNQFAERGHAYLVFFFTIVFASFISDYLAQFVLTISESAYSGIEGLAFLNAVVTGLAVADYYWRYV